MDYVFPSVIVHLFFNRVVVSEQVRATPETTNNLGASNRVAIAICDHH